MRGGELKHMVGVVALAAGVFLAVAAGIPEWKRWQYRDVRQALLDELQPVALSNCTLARVGSTNDGGYLMCANLISGIQVAYSYGVGPNDEPVLPPQEVHVVAADSGVHNRLGKAMAAQESEEGPLQLASGEGGVRHG